MKSVLISIQPQWCELIASGKKTMDVRKTRPKLETPFKVYIYCTNTRPYLVWGDVFRGDWETEFTHIRGYSREQAEKIWDVFNGHIIGEFICDAFVIDKTFGRDALFNSAACMTDIECAAYSCGSPIYGWHISDLKIYDNPRDIQEFFRACDKKDYTDCTACIESGNSNCTRLNRPPQSWCYVEEV